jgi:metallo-beta-lactamase family protein
LSTTATGGSARIEDDRGPAHGAPGLLCEGAKQVKIHGHFVPVAARIEQIDSMSAHADAGEIMRWLSGFSRPPSMTYLVHGEPVPLQTLASRIAAEKQWPVHIAKYLERVELNLG